MKGKVGLRWNLNAEMPLKLLSEPLSVDLLENQGERYKLILDVFPTFPPTPMRLGQKILGKNQIDFIDLRADLLSILSISKE